MKLNKCAISLTDFVYSDKLESFFEELGSMERILNIKPDWKKSPIALGRRVEITLSEFSDKLDFVDNIKIILNQYQNFSSVIMITIETELNTSSLDKIQKNVNYEKNKLLFESYEKQIWEFWKENIHSTILIKNQLTTLSPISIIHFHMSSDKYDEFVKDIQNTNSKNETKSITSLLTNYGANTLGLASVLSITNQTLSIVSQHRAVYHTDGLDFTGIMFFDVKNETWKNDISPSYYKIISYQHYRYWLEIRKQQIISWKDDIENLSKTIKQYVTNFSNFDPSNGFALFAQKSSFQIEYASLMDEHRYLQRILGEQLREIRDPYFGERVVKTEFFEMPNKNIGFLKNLSDEIIEQAMHLHDEFDVIKGQYNNLGEELSQLTNFVNTQSQLKSIKEDQKTQRTIKKQGKYMLLSTIAVIFLTSVLLLYAIQEYNITNFDSQFTATGGDILLIGPYDSKQFEYLSPIHISTMNSHHYKYTISPVNASIRVTGYGDCFFQSIPKIPREDSMTFYLSSGGDEIELEPRFRFNYADTLNYFSPEKMQNSTFYSVGSMKFQLIAQDLQEPEKIESFLIHTGLVMKLPSGFDSQKKCEGK